MNAKTSKPTNIHCSDNKGNGNNNNNYIGQQRGFLNLYSNQNTKSINYINAPKRQKLNNSQYQHNHNHNHAFDNSTNAHFSNSFQCTNSISAQNDHAGIPALDAISVSPEMEPKSEQKSSLSLPALNEEHSQLQPSFDREFIYNNNNSNDYSYFPDFCNVRRLNLLLPIPGTAIMDNINNNNNDDSTLIFEPVSDIQSASCHQCKTKKDIHILFYCTKSKPKKHVAYKTKLVKCKKKYCTSCMTKYFNDCDVNKFKKYKDSISWSFDCPSCQGVCTCGACKRRRVKNQTSKTIQLI